MVAAFRYAGIHSKGGVQASGANQSEGKQWLAPQPVKLYQYRTEIRPQKLMAGTVEWLLHDVEVRDDQLRVGDRIGREGGGMPLVHFRAQPLGRLADVKREGCVLLNLTEMFHRIPVPSSDWETRQPRLR